MRLAVAISILATQKIVKNQTLKTIKLLKENQSKNLTYILYDNGSDPAVVKWLKKEETDILIHSDKNNGLPIAYNTMLEKAKSLNIDYLFCTHSDIEMFEKDWDLKIIKSIEEANKIQEVGIAGFYGAFGVGTYDIYKTHYYKGQLARINPVAGTKCLLKPEVHHHAQFSQDWIKVACLDGFSQIIKVDTKIRLDETLGYHHFYDTELGLQAYELGYQVICINAEINHIGGITDVNENWNADFKQSKSEVHDFAHIKGYEKWDYRKNENIKIKLPFRI